MTPSYTPLLNYTIRTRLISSPSFAGNLTCHIHILLEHSFSTIVSTNPTPSDGRE